jgi:two-component system phosphate regulon sensor histidine kinase PhoR
MVSFHKSDSEWVHTVAHDLKTPINSVRGCVDMVMQLGPLNERQEHFAERALAGLKRMEHMVNRLLDITWVDADTPLDVDEISLSHIVYENVDMLREMADKRNVHLEVEIDPRIDRVMADARRLGQVIDNLVSNAIKYNREGGTVTISAVHQYDSLLVMVKDSGIGIASDEQARVFERFFRSRRGIELKIEGTGLGLAIARAIVNKHNGRIWFESQPDEGTTFFFTLPLQLDSEGNDSSDDSNQDLGEGPEGHLLHPAILASEATDSVDDNLQENRDGNDGDESSSDER